MKRIWKHVGVTLSTALVASAIGSACADSNAAVYVAQVLSPPQPSNGVCLYTPDPTSPLENAGYVDVAFAGIGSYTPVFLVANQIQPQANVAALQVETSTVILTGAITRITDLQGNDVVTMLSNLFNSGTAAEKAAAQKTGLSIKHGLLGAPTNPFSTAESGIVQPSSGATPSYGVLATTIVDGNTIAILRDYYENLIEANGILNVLGSSTQLLTYTKVEGTTLGGDPEETAEFEFPVTICYGCLINNLQASDATVLCLAPSSSSAAIPPCVPGQESPTPDLFPDLFEAEGVLPLCPSPDAGTGAGVKSTTGDAGL